MKTIKGYYGSQRTPCNVFYYQKWYCVEGSVNVNHTEEDITDGTDVEEVRDNNCFTWNKPINSLEELIEAVEA